MTTSAALTCGFSQRFDAKQSSPALIKLLEKGTLPVKDARVFVPGCGRGYDCVAFSQAGAKETVGLELAESAVRGLARVVVLCAEEW